MKVVVFGGTGRIGSQVVDGLRKSGADVVAASPASGVDALTGEGVQDVVRGADLTIDVMNAMIFDAATAIEFFGTCSRNIVSAARAAGVGRHVLLSIVGADRMADSGYMAGKLAQEKAVEDGGVPYTIVRATQFIEFLGGIADGSEIEGRIVLPRADMQPIAASEVAAFVVDVVLDPESPARVDIAGPQRMSMAEAVRRGIGDDPRPVIERDDATYFGAVVSSDELVPIGPARLGHLTIEDVVPQS